MHWFYIDGSRLARLATVASLAVLLVACGGGGAGGGGGSNPAPTPITVTFTTSPPSQLATAAKAGVAAIVANDPSNAGVNWTASCAGGNCGTFSASSTSSGTLTTYTAPAMAPSPATITLTATSLADGSVSTSSVVTVVPGSAAALADGTYVYHLSGQDGAGPYSVSGAFQVAGGVIVGGEQDYTDVNGGYTDSIQPATSSVGAAGSNVQIVLDTGNPAYGVNGIETLRATSVSPNRMLLSQFDLSAQATGSLERQTSVAMPDAGYAFAVSGSNTSGNLIAIGGILNLSAGALSPNGSVFDISVANPGTATSTASRGQMFSGGTVSAPDSYGRVVFNLTPSVASGVQPFALAGYIIGDRIQLVESAQNGDLLNANTGGVALAQRANTDRFTPTSSSVTGQSYAHGSLGLDANGGVAMAGAFALNTDGSIGGRLAINDQTFRGVWQLGGSYSVDPTGRVTVSVTSLTSTTAAPPASTMTFQLYLDGQGNALVLGADPFQTTQGLAFVQAGSTALAGNYALSAQGTYTFAGGTSAWTAVGPAAVTGGNFSGTVDYNPGGALPQPSVTLGGYQDAGSGLLQLTGLNPYDPTQTSAFGYYPLSGNRLWAIEVDSTGPALLMMEGVSQ